MLRPDLVAKFLAAEAEENKQNDVDQSMLDFNSQAATEPDDGQARVDNFFAAGPDRFFERKRVAIPID